MSESTSAPTATTDEAAADLGDVCSLVSADEIGAIVGGAVTPEEVPGGGCSFNQEDPRAASVSLSQLPYDEGTGGLDGALAGITGVTDGTAEAIDGIGEGAYVVVGPQLGGENDQGAGVAQLGDSLVQVGVLQGNGLPAPQVRELTVAVMQLISDKG